ncbi:MAG TPA: AMP-binding protein [Casimicrobiaceae bacterium]|nr:AMP-binding protein [Casimicrobiaceae bacterium]
MNVADWLERSARTFPRAPALFHGERLVADYATLMRRAGQVARSLREDLRLAPGERVAICMSNAPQYLEVVYGVWTAGLVAVPINAKLHPKEVRYIIEHSGAAVLFVTRDIDPGVADVQPTPVAFIAGDREYDRLCTGTAMTPEHRAPDDLAWLFYTSGTTGRPKGVMLSHRNLLAMSACYFIDVHGAAKEDTAIYAAPFSHGAGLYNFPHVRAAARHVVPESGGFEPAELCALAAHHRNACLFAAPTMVKRLVDEVEHRGARSDGFRTIVYGGGPMYIETIQRALEVMGECFVQIYGQGETPMTITALSKAHLADRAHPRYRERLGSVGVAQSLVQVRVCDTDGRSLAPGAVGEVVVKGETVMRGYWRNAEATAQALRDGWLFTGDVGSFDDDGFLTLKDRSKDVIISGGANIYPREVEEVLLMHPGVDEASVIGRADAEWGEVVVAFVVGRPRVHVTSGELDALCLDHLARFKRPREYRFVAALPKNNYGKVLKTALREALARRLARGRSAAALTQHIGEEGFRHLGAAQRVVSDVAHEIEPNGDAVLLVACAQPREALGTIAAAVVGARHPVRLALVMHDLEGLEIDAADDHLHRHAAHGLDVDIHAEQLAHVAHTDPPVARAIQQAHRAGCADRYRP